ncbi:MAG: TCR/Tet family MFS transporter [Paracoccaceae bacterium]|nr:TCR/Tet family MFS transporter [Paracoccaceae bacterium]
MRMTLGFILTTVVIDSMGIGLILPVMPALLREIGDIPLTEAALWGGILTTAFSLMQFLFGPVVGAISDRFGRRPVLLVSLFVMALDYLVMAVAQVFWLLLLARIVGGITAASQSTAAAAIADISKPEEKAARFGLIGAAFGLGFVLGPMLGGILGEYGTRAPFYAAAGLAALNCLFGYFVMPETVTDETRRPFTWARANPLGAFTQVGLNPELRRLLLLFFLYQVAFFVYPATWAFFTTARFGWSEGMIGLSLASFGVAMALVQGGLIRWILKWLGDRGTVIYGLVFNTCAFIVLAFITNGTLALLFIPLTALGAVVTPAVQGIMSRKTADDAQGELQGVLTSAGAMAAMISPLLMTGVFWRFADENAAIFLPGAPFLVSMALMLVCMVVFLTPARRQAA